SNAKLSEVVGIFGADEQKTDTRMKLVYYLRDILIPLGNG
ncbi:MAG: hypothetical protein RI887_204, partial [Actinomycetota bacterium]